MGITGRVAPDGDLGTRVMGIKWSWAEIIGAAEGNDPLGITLATALGGDLGIPSLDSKSSLAEKILGAAEGAPPMGIKDGVARGGDLGNGWLGISRLLAEIILIDAAEGMSCLGISQLLVLDGDLGRARMGITGGLAEIIWLLLYVREFGERGPRVGGPYSRKNSRFCR
jgi:hypothetical protein